MSVVNECEYVDFGPLFYKFKNMYRISIDHIEIFGQTIIECLLCNEYKFIAVNNLPSIFVSVWSWATPKYDMT